MILVTIILVTLAGLSLLNSFFLHLSPDTTIYLLHARTFVQELNRFEASHDSKGFFLTLILAPAVAVFGATMKAAALMQCFAYVACAYLMYRICRRWLNVHAARILPLLWIVIAFSPAIWGGRVRPEDFGTLYTMAVFCLALTNHRWSYLGSGVLLACAFWTKTTLFIPPALIIVCAATGLSLVPLALSSGSSWKEPWREWGRNLGQAGLGFLGLSGILLTWIILFDDPGNWWNQSVIWPLTLKQHLGDQSPVAIMRFYALVNESGLSVLVLVAVCGLVVGWFKGSRRFIGLLTAFVAGECGRIYFENGPWFYLLIGAMPPLILGCALFGFKPKHAFTPHWAWLVPCLVLVEIALTTSIRQVDVFRHRVLHRTPSPYEALAGELGSIYKEGETMLPTGNDYQILLHLDAPPPYPLLPCHLNVVSREEQLEVLDHYTRNPPEWIIDANHKQSPVAFAFQGRVDDLLLIYEKKGMKPPRQVTESSFKLGDPFSPTHPAREFRHVLLTAQPYRLVVDLGCLQAWRLED